MYKENNSKKDDKPENLYLHLFYFFMYILF